ncbi:FxSxx-COOH system tetratricopeptide repeat protein [Nonomuraea sp. MTCD27]|uniref:FxSxx-COOH system tetratricopeptide repeat protein n=1 Tax=Nonomuraea sp. MTCD27 TaxID=1676747 RepID=UPI0035BFA45E
MDERANERATKMPPVWGRVPPRNRNFTGREALLSRLGKSMAGGATTAVVAHSPVPQALHGLGGVGKTQLVTEYAWRFRSSYDVVWWIASDQPALVPATLAALAPELGLPSANVVGIDEAAVAVRKALQQGTPYDKWLLIFDNADEPESIKDFIPDGGPGRVLITSRNNRWTTTSESVAVDVFERDESLAFLRKRLERELPRDEAHRLAEALGDLPLALEQAAALQLMTGMPTEEYIEALEEQTRPLLALGKATEYPHSMTAAWQLSVQAIEERMPEAATVLRCLAFFGPDPIPRDVFRRGNKVSEATSMAPILADPLLLNKAIGELNRFALIKVEPSTRTITVHRLIQSLLRDSVSADQRESLRHEVHLLLAGSAPTSPEDTAKWPAFGELLPHVEPSGLSSCYAEPSRRTCLDVVRYLYRVGDYRAARNLGEALRAAWTAQLGVADPHVLRLRRHLANTLWQLGEFTESRLMNEETLELMQETFGADHEETLAVANSYGSNLRALGEFERARSRDDESLLAYESKFGPTHPGALRMLHNLGLDHALLSDHLKARDLLKLTYLEMSSATKGISPWDVQNAWNCLALVVRLCGDFEEACDLAEDAYAYGLRELSPEHPLTLKASKELSIAKRAAGDLSTSLELIQDTYSRTEKVLGPNNPDTMASAMALSNTLREAGRLDEAFVLAKETMTRYRTVYGNQHPYTYGCQSNLALLYRLRGNAARALEEDTDAYKGLLDRLGPKHIYTFTAAVNRGGDLAALGDFAAACRQDHETVELLASSFGERHYLTLSATVNLALDLRASGREEEAERLTGETLSAYREAFDPDHPHLLRALKGERASWDFDPPPL